MVWQDITIGLVNLCLNYAIIPQIYEGIKKQKCPINLQTAIIMPSSLFILGSTLLTLNLYFATITTYFGGLLWSIVLMQKLSYK